MTLTPDTVLLALADHIGRDRGVSARDLVVEIAGEWSARLERDLRHAIEQLRIDGYAVCADPSAGYHVAADDAELQASIRFLRRRALTSLRQVRQMKRATPGLSGQRRLML